MDHYTLDTVGLLYYIGDFLPSPVDDLFQDAHRGEIVIELPYVAATEAIYLVETRDEFGGVTIDADGSDVAAAIVAKIPVTIVGGTIDEVSVLPEWTDEFPDQIHDSMIVTSHVSRDTEAIITPDERIHNNAPTVWD